MKLTIGYTAYHEIEVEAPPEIEEASLDSHQRWEEYAADPLTAPYPCDYAEEEKIRRWTEKITDRLEGLEELKNVSVPENGEVIYMD